MATASRDPNPGASPASISNFARLFLPKLITVLREGYGAAEARRDVIAGATVAVVALPLSMAIAIASGATPEMGLVTAIVGGFLVSALGGSRFQIGGPAGAFIVLVSATVAQHGLDGLMLATILAGVLLVIGGLLQLGTFAKLIPYPVTVGFTAGIAAIIFASQLSAFLGLEMQDPEPGPILDKIPALIAAAPSLHPEAVAIALGVVLLILVQRRLAAGWPGMLAAVVLASVIGAVAGLDVATIGSVFGGISGGIPSPRLPDVSYARVLAVAPDAVAFALLGAIESLLSAVVSDGMTGRRHRSNAELVAQGVANIAAGLFGGFCVTGAIARTATNVRAGAHGPVAGMAHSMILLVFLLVAAPLADYVPLAALAGVLTVVAWDMIEKPAIGMFLRGPRGDAGVFAATLLLTLFRDLTEAIVIGSALGALLFIRRMSKLTAFENAAPMVSEDRPDGPRDSETPWPVSGDVLIYRLRGVLFFGAAPIADGVLDRIGESVRGVALDLSRTPFIDVSGLHMIEEIARRVNRHGGVLALAGANAEVSATFAASAVLARKAVMCVSLEDAIRAAEAGPRPGRVSAPVQLEV